MCWSWNRILSAFFASIFFETFWPPRLFHPKKSRAWGKPLNILGCCPIYIYILNTTELSRCFFKIKQPLLATTFWRVGRCLGCFQAHQVTRSVIQVLWQEALYPAVKHCLVTFLGQDPRCGWFGWWLFWCKPRGYEVPGGCWLGLLVGLFTRSPRKNFRGYFFYQAEMGRKNFRARVFKGCFGTTMVCLYILFWGDVFFSWWFSMEFWSHGILFTIWWTTNWGGSCFLGVVFFTNFGGAFCNLDHQKPPKKKSKLLGCFNTPLEHTPKPLPACYKGIPFIVG